MFMEPSSRKVTPPQLAARAHVIAVLAVLGFAALLFRLWSLEVVHGPQYRAEATAQSIRATLLPAARGEVVDRHGTVLVESRVATAVTIAPRALPHGRRARAALYRRLGSALALRPSTIRRRIARGRRRNPFGRPAIKDGVNFAELAYILERRRRFPGVRLEREYLRTYPYGQVGAQLFGTIGQVTARELRMRRFKGVHQNDRVGQSGIEYAYDRYLRGRDGALREQVNAIGHPLRTLRSREPTPGDRLELSIDLNVERMGEQVLTGRRGAFVVMNVRDGELLGLGSSPSFDPGLFTRTVRPAELRALDSPARGAPLEDRATQGLYPTGSAFKPITAVAALEGRLITPATPVFDGGSLQVGGITFKNAGGVAHGTIELPRALAISSDVFFYRLGLEANGAGDGLLIQRWAGRLGLGRPTGVELPGAFSGLIPSPRWRDHLFARRQTDRPWSAGDNVNLAVGQGDVQVTPLQLARAYAAIANGGWLVRPHLGLAVRRPDGSVRPLRSGRRRRVPIAPQYAAAILEGLREAASAPGGTSADVFRGFPVPVAGKTGTAQKGAGRPDQSWYVALAPWPHIRYVVAVTDETGGWGAQTAAPDARRILAALYGLKGAAARAVRGASHTF